jgi:glycosyltransferase involved in cell wall biosynthesis
MFLHSYYLEDVRVTRQAEALAAAGYDVHVVCDRRTSPTDHSSEPLNETYNGVHIHRLPLNRKRGSKTRYLFEFLSMIILGCWKLATLHSKHKFRIVHIHNMPDSLVVAGLIPKLAGATLVLDIHDPMAELFQANYHVTENNPVVKLIKLQEWLSYKMPDHLVTVSVPMAENLSNKSNRPISSIKVVHNFTDLDRFPVTQTTVDWPRNKDSFVLLYAGTITEHYALHTAVRAVALLADRIPNIHFRMLGDGNRVDSVLALARELGIADRVEHKKRVPIEEVKRFMAEADIGISPHNAGPFGNLYFSNKIVDFMTQGIPVVSSRTYTIEKYIPEEALFYFEPDNPQELSDKILHMRTHPSLVQDKIRLARDLVSNYNWQAEKHNLVRFYEDLSK